MDKFVLTDSHKDVLRSLADWPVNRLKTLLNCEEEFRDLFESLLSLYNNEITVEQFEEVSYGREYWAIYVLYNEILQSRQIAPKAFELATISNIIETDLLPRIKNCNYNF